MVKTLKPKHTFYDKDLVTIFPGSRVLKSGLNIVQMYDNVVISKLQTKLNEITWDITATTQLPELLFQRSNVTLDLYLA